jgi:hypothetical protein
MVSFRFVTRINNRIEAFNVLAHNAHEADEFSLVWERKTGGIVLTVS